MSDKKQTAVEWIEDNIQSDMTFVDVFGLIRHAKEMEKQQIIDSLHYFGIENAEEYYTETYGGQTYEQ
jgi:hypothetical protein